MNQIKEFFITIKQLSQQFFKPLSFPYGGKIKIKDIIVCFFAIIVYFIFSIALGAIIVIAFYYYRFIFFIVLGVIIATALYYYILSKKEKK